MADFIDNLKQTLGEKFGIKAVGHEAIGNPYWDWVWDGTDWKMRFVSNGSPAMGAPSVPKPTFIPPEGTPVGTSYKTISFLPSPDTDKLGSRDLVDDYYATNPLERPDKIGIPIDDINLIPYANPYPGELPSVETIDRPEPITWKPQGKAWGRNIDSSGYNNRSYSAYGDINRYQQYRTATPQTNSYSSYGGRNRRNRGGYLGGSGYLNS